MSRFDAFGLDWLDTASDLSAGFGDTISFAFTHWVRDQMESNGAADPCSDAYGVGEWAGVGYGFAACGAAGWRAAGKKAAGKEFSHWIPNRLGGPRSLWNGNYVSPSRHYYHNPFRHPRGWRDLGENWPAWLPQWDRIPNIYKGAAAGAAAGATASGSCGSQ